jgi:urease accessory protein
MPMRRAIAVHARGSWPLEKAVDTVTLAFLDRHRRRIRLVADSGEAFLLDLARAQRMGDGDALVLESGGYLRISAAAEPVIEISAADTTSLVRIAWHLGNRHLPVQVIGDCLRIRADHVIAAMIEGLGGRISRLDVPFDPEAGAYGAAPSEHEASPPGASHDHG